MQQTIRALGRLAPQQETAIKVLRQDVTWIKENQQKGAVSQPLGSVLTTCLFEHLLKILQELTGPTLENAKNQGWLNETGRQCQTWSASLGALTVDSAKAPVSVPDLILLQGMNPLLAVHIW